MSYAEPCFEKYGQVVDHDKWPDDFNKWVDDHPGDDTVIKARKSVIENIKNRGKWGLLTDKGKYINSFDDFDKMPVNHVVIRSGDSAKTAKRTNCHELAGALLNRLVENRIKARRVLFDKDLYNGVPMGHSTVFFQDKNDRWHRATSGMGRRHKSPLGDFDSLEDAIDQYIAVEKANKQTTDDERLDVYDTTDVPFTDRMPWPEYLAAAKKGKRLYHQEGK